ncbi:MAG: serine/threonine protein kinase [Acidobacteria bacterium]|nr:MAG: serine/threonine protein kinase [Acidobacteriota bacterium]
MSTELLGSYRLIDRLGAGGMGEVWRAEDTRLLRSVAIKILSERIANDPEWKARFLREARTIAQMNHPNIATIYSIEQEAEKLFIVMELVEGESLATVLARGPLPPQEAVRMMQQVAEALAEAHEKGVVHRDVKPDNVIVGKRSVKVLDFGIAKQLVSSTETPTLTQAGLIVGTPFYMSPEQALGKPVDARSDLFSLGVVLYEALTGKRPFEGESVTETMMNIIMQEAPDLSTTSPASLPPSLVEIVNRALQKKPERRFGSAGEMVDALARVDFKTGSAAKAPAKPPKIDAPTVAMPSAPQPAQTPIPGQRALIADDDPVTRYLIANILAQRRIAFDEAANGADAVKALKAHEYTLVFLDLMMPRVDGWGVIDFLRRSKTKPPRIVVITGVKDQTLSVADRELVSGLIYKPLDPSEVDRVVQQTLSVTAG